MIALNIDEDVCKFGATIKVIGVGGGGGNAVNSMISSNEFIDNIEFMVANTDLQALKQSLSLNKIQLGTKITKGLGAGANPDLGKKAAEEDLDAIMQHLLNTDILFLTAGLGGGTGTGALPVIVNTAKEMGILTIAVVTKPFFFEGKRRMRYAIEAIEALREIVDTLIVVPNQRLIEISDSNITMLNAFAKSDDILKQAIKGISDIITQPGHINVDFADVRTIMKDTGMAIMGIGRASGPNRAKDAAMAAINSQLLENTNIHGAKGILINITGNSSLGLQEISAATNFVSDMVNEDANIIFGTVINDEMGDEIAITVIATGFEDVKFTDVQQKTVESKSIQNTFKTTNNNNLLCATDAQNEKIDLDNLDTPTFMRKKIINKTNDEIQPQ